jgi:TetR/AcrR family transcriptional regulator
MMAATTPTRPPSERADQTRARILDAAVREFSEHGLAGARTEAIAQAAGVNKALLYYYFKSKDALYAAALESIAKRVRATSFAVLDAPVSAGERFVKAALDHFDRIHTNWQFQSMMQQEMVRLHRGEEHAMTPLVESVFKPLAARLQEVLEEGIASGELIAVDQSQIRSSAIGANVYYFLSAPLMRMVTGIDPLERSELEKRRQLTVEFLGQAIFRDRHYGAEVARHVLETTPMPTDGGIRPRPAADGAKKTGKVRHK